MTTKTQRYRQLDAPAPPSRWRIAFALRQTFHHGYKLADLKADVLAGLVVGIVALPLSMALAIASGVPPQYGLYTAIIAGGVIPLFGGSRVNVSGPTAAFVVLLVPVSSRFGTGGLLLASLMAGVILLAMGIGRLGRLIHFIPHPVTTGFTAGIAVVIATLQVKDFLGLAVAGAGEHYWERVRYLADALPTLRWEDAGIGALTLAILFVWPKLVRKVPAPLVAVTIGALAAWLARRIHPEFEVATIGSRFSYTLPDGTTGAGIPMLPPLPLLPWDMPGPDGAATGFGFDLLRALIGPAFAIAMLGAIESLLCAVVADTMAGTKHDPDAELIGQGIGNVLAPFFGGFAATGAIARTATNIRSGGRSPVAAVVHAVFVLVAVLSLGQLLAYLPMASLAALLLLVAWNMSDLKHFGHMLRVAPKSDLTVLLACFLLTVFFDMVISVGAGIVLAALLFMRRMAEISTTRLLDPAEHPHLEHLPKDVLLYEIAGPLFFGAAEKAANTLGRVPVDARAAILHLDAVPVVDVTGLVALETAIGRLQARGLHVILAAVQPQPARVFAKSGLVEVPGRLSFRPTLAEAVELAHPGGAAPEPGSRITRVT